MNPRAAGVLLHPSSLANPYPIGDLGPAAIAFADFLAAAGQRWWQMIPVGPVGSTNSPYQSSSAFAGNPLLLSLDRLMEQGFLVHADLDPPTPAKEGKVGYHAAALLKLPALKTAFGRFETIRNAGALTEFDAFAQENSFWLEDFSLFSAIEENEGTANWTRWSQALRLRQPATLARARKHYADQIRFHQFVQWQFSVQWKELRAYCASKAIRLIGDVPAFVAHHSADVWAHPGLFKLDADGNPTVVAGVPPDYFSKNGQVWDVPVYRWDVLKAQNYSWWIERLGTACRRFDVNRLDHFIGFVRTYEVPAAAVTAEHGQYQAGGGAAFFAAVRAALGSLPFIADDLGATTTGVVELLNQCQIPGTRVLQFEIGSNAGAKQILVEPHPLSAVVYTGTHDNDTTAGWYAKLPGAQRATLRKQLGANDGQVVWGLINLALASTADTVIIPMQDLLELGSEARMNFPGRADGNWQWRLGEGVLTADLACRLRSVSAACRRLPPGASGTP